MVLYHPSNHEIPWNHPGIPLKSPWNSIEITLEFHWITIFRWLKSQFLTRNRMSKPGIRTLTILGSLLPIASAPLSWNHCLGSPESENTLGSWKIWGTHHLNISWSWWSWRNVRRCLIFVRGKPGKPRFISLGSSSFSLSKMVILWYF